MKIWTITTDQDGECPATAVHTTEAAALAHFARIVAASWESWFGDDADPMPDDVEKALENLQNEAGFFDSVIMAEHDISCHPDLAAIPSPDADTRFLLDAAKGLLFAHDHGNGLEGWHNTREKLREAIARFGRAGDHG